MHSWCDVLLKEYGIHLPLFAGDRPITEQTLQKIKKT